MIPDTCTPDCTLCLHGKPTPSSYRPHTLAPDCWCQDYKDDYPAYMLEVSPKRCGIEKRFTRARSFAA